MNIIAETNVGSHVWQMNHKDSDIDTFQIYTEELQNILNGTAKRKSYFTEKENGITDIAIHEIEIVINQLLKGNINFIVGVCSPLILKTTKEFEILRNLTTNHLAKNCYHSINGLAVHNFKKYENELTEKKLNQIIRTLFFGINILKHNKIIFQPNTNGTTEKYFETLELLKESFENSSLPEEPEEKPFRDFLLNLRLKQLYKNDPLMKLWDNPEDERWNNIK
jgi:predicted nucleotidyltransferase